MWSTRTGPGRWCSPVRRSARRRAGRRSEGVPSARSPPAKGDSWRPVSQAAAGSSGRTLQKATLRFTFRMHRPWVPPPTTSLNSPLAGGVPLHDGGGRRSARGLGSERCVQRCVGSKPEGDIADPYRGFHVIVPPEYRRLGCLPADQFVPQLMQHLGEPYYVALLSAAELHGAAHQRPQAFQVMVETNRRAIECGEVRVQFIARRRWKTTSVVERKTPRGLLRVASPEATALELVGYADQCGGLDNVAAVLAELVEPSMRIDSLPECERSPIAWVQRLGYLLDLTEHRDLADKLAAVRGLGAPRMSPRSCARRVGAVRRATNAGDSPSTSPWSRTCDLARTSSPSGATALHGCWIGRSSRTSSSRARSSSSSRENRSPRCSRSEAAPRSTSSTSRPPLATPRTSTWFRRNPAVSVRCSTPSTTRSIPGWESHSGSSPRDA
jgi:hypothetical protein